MSWRRRAAAPRLIEWTGERCVPWAPDVPVIYEHFHRYLWASGLVDARTVLDLGSGEGFGSALLAENAGRVLGIDIDERAVEHSRLNYAAANLQFQVGTATDLSEHPDASFGAVVAFEIIEHLRDQERVLAEIARVLTDDGLLLISTPDRRTYSEVTGQVNPFHERELGLEEFVEALGAHFPHVAVWGQRTITGSHMNRLTSTESAQETEQPSDFYLEREGEEWRLAGDPAALYCVAIASRTALPGVAAVSTLADCGLELVRVKERDTVAVAAEREEARTLAEHLELALERERGAHQRAMRAREGQWGDELLQRNRDLGTAQEIVAELKQQLHASERELAVRSHELAEARHLNRQVEESVTWQAFQRLRGRVFGAIGERSLLARALRMSLRIAGRALKGSKRQQVSAPSSSECIETVEIVLPEYENPKVSLIIPLHARPDLTRACLHSIREHTTHASYEVILVEDAADPETKKLMNNLKGARILRNDDNAGYLRSVNRGASVAHGEWLVLCNNDTEFTHDWLGAMLACAESADDVGVVTPKYVYPDGTLNEAGGIIWRDGTGMNYGRGDVPHHFQYEYRRETDYGSAAALMVRTALWRELGGYDERYLPMYYEDADLCFEAREHGMRVLYEPEAIVVHVEGATAGNDVGSGHKRHQEQNRAKFLAKWRHRLESEQSRYALPNIRGAADRRRGRRVLVVDYRVPMWHHDAGSLRMLSIIRGLLEQGARVTFLPDNFLALQPYTRELQRLGVEVLYGELDINAELATLGPKLKMAILSRPHVASRWLDMLRELAPSARIVYDTVDLHWLREARKHALGGVGWSAGVGRNGSFENLPPKARALRELERAMIRAADTTFVVSTSERQQVQRELPDAEVVIVPTVHDVHQYVPQAPERSGILFVGGFAHPPNVDAALCLVKEVMPLVWRELGDVRVAVVGPDPPSEIQALAGPLVDVTGWIEDLRPFFEESRLMLAPLRFGAGLKGKITESLAMGLPVVTTSVGAEGLDDAGEECMLVGDDPQVLAAHVIRLYRDDEVWRRLSRAGRDLISTHCSSAVVTARLGDLLDTQGAPTRAVSEDVVV